MKWMISPSHAWLRLNVDQHPNALRYASRFSFVSRDGREVFLEEDVDATAFIEFEGIDLDLVRNCDVAHVGEHWGMAHDRGIAESMFQKLREHFSAGRVEVTA